MDKIMRALIVVLVIGLLAFAPIGARAQTPLVPTQIIIGASGVPDANGSMTVQAVLGDSQGHPISKAVIYFTSQTNFLSGTSDVVLAQAVTNASGQAVAHFTDTFSGPMPLSAEFKGDAQYAPSNVTVQVGGASGGQEYVDHVGVDLPGYNVPPVGGAAAASVGLSRRGFSGFIQSLWPAMNGWPIAAVLLLVWSLYFFAMTFVLRVARAGVASADLPDFDSRRSP